MPYFHNISPFLVRFSGDFGIRWYGLSYVAAFIIAYLLMSVLARRKLILIPESRVGDAMIFLILGTLIGGRLGYVFFYDRSLLTLTTSQAPWWGVLAINRGGMASHGGMIGLAIACWRISRGFKESTKAGEVIIGRSSFFHVMDVAAFVAPIGVMLGRIANFINGELLGRIIASPGAANPPWWTVQYPQELALPRSQLPHTGEQWAKVEQLAQTVAPAGSLEPIPDGLHILSTYPHGGPVVVEQLKSLVSYRAPSQLVQAFAEGIVLGLVLLILWARPRTPGVIAAAFLITYGVLRIATEFVRLPDSHLEQQYILGLTRGQWLSVGMLATGAIVLAIAMKSPRRAKLGGWLRSSPGSPTS